MYQDVSSFRVRPATHMISLGVGCMTAYNLRRHFNFMSAFPFDWWVTRTPGLLAFLPELDVDRLYDPELLFRSDNHASVTNREFDIHFHHEFPRHWDQPTQPVRDDWAASIPQAKERTAALVTKFRALSAPGNRVAFFREHETPMAPLVDALENILGDVEWTFIPCNLPSDAGFDWKGNPVAWDAFLASTGLTLDRANHRDFVDSRHLMDH